MERERLFIGTMAPVSLEEQRGELRLAMSAVR